MADEAAAPPIVVIRLLNGHSVPVSGDDVADEQAAVATLSALEGMAATDQLLRLSAACDAHSRPEVAMLFAEAAAARVRGLEDGNVEADGNSNIANTEMEPERIKYLRHLSAQTIYLLKLSIAYRTKLASLSQDKAATELHQVLTGGSDRTPRGALAKELDVLAEEAERDGMEFLATYARGVLELYRRQAALLSVDSRLRRARAQAGKSAAAPSPALQGAPDSVKAADARQAISRFENDQKRKAKAGTKAAAAAAAAAAAGAGGAPTPDVRPPRPAEELVARSLQKEAHRAAANAGKHFAQACRQYEQARPQVTLRELLGSSHPMVQEQDEDAVHAEAGGVRNSEADNLFAGDMEVEYRPLSGKRDKALARRASIKAEQFQVFQQAKLMEGVALLLQGRVAGAHAIFADHIRTQPHKRHPAVYVLLGMCLLRHDFVGVAARAMDRALEVAPDYVPALVGAAVLHEAWKREEYSETFRVIAAVPGAASTEAKQQLLLTRQALQSAQQHAVEDLLAAHHQDSNDSAVLLHLARLKLTGPPQPVLADGQPLTVTVRKGSGYAVLSAPATRAGLAPGMRVTVADAAVSDTGTANLWLSPCGPTVHPAAPNDRSRQPLRFADDASGDPALLHDMSEDPSLGSGGAVAVAAQQPAGCVVRLARPFGGQDVTDAPLCLPPCEEVLRLLAAAAASAATPSQRGEAAFLAGRCLQMLGDWGAAQAHYEAALALLPQSGAAMVSCALCLLHRGMQFTRSHAQLMAIKSCTKAVQDGNASESDRSVASRAPAADVLQKSLRSALVKGRQCLEQAQKLLEVAHELAPDDATAAMLLSRLQLRAAMRQSGRPDSQSLRMAKHASRASKNHVGAALNYAFQLLLGGSSDQPTLRSILEVLSAASRTMQRSGLAIPHEVWHNLGVTALRAGQLDRADKALTRALGALAQELLPGAPAEEMADGRVSESLRRRVMVTERGLPTAYCLALAQLRGGARQAGQATLKHLLERHPGFTAAHLRLSEMSLLKGDLVAAGARLKEAEQLAPKAGGRIDALLARARLFRLLGDDKAEAEQLEKAAQVARADRAQRARDGRKKAPYCSDDVSDTTVVLAQLSQLSRRLPLLPPGTAHAVKRENILKRLFSGYQSVLRISQSDADAVNGLAVVLMEQGRLPLARRVLEAAREATRNTHPCILLNLAHVLAATDPKDRRVGQQRRLAVDLYQHALQRFFPAGLGRAAGVLGPATPAATAEEAGEAAAAEAAQAGLPLARLLSRADAYRVAVARQHRDGRPAGLGGGGQLNGGASHVEVLLYTARAQALNHDFAGSAATLRRAVRVDPADARLWYNLALVCGRDSVAALNRGERELTLAQVQRAQALMRSSQQILRRLLVDLCRLARSVTRARQLQASWKQASQAGEPLPAMWPGCASVQPAEEAAAEAGGPAALDQLNGTLDESGEWSIPEVQQQAEAAARKDLPVPVGLCRDLLKNCLPALNRAARLLEQKQAEAAEELQQREARRVAAQAQKEAREQKEAAARAEEEAERARAAESARALMEETARRRAEFIERQRHKEEAARAAERLKQSARGRSGKQARAQATKEEEERLGAFFDEEQLPGEQAAPAGEAVAATASAGGERLQQAEHAARQAGAASAAEGPMMAHTRGRGSEADVFGVGRAMELLATLNLSGPAPETVPAPLTMRAEEEEEAVDDALGTGLSLASLLDGLPVLPALPKPGAASGTRGATGLAAMPQEDEDLGEDDDEARVDELLGAGDAAGPQAGATGATAGTEARAEGVAATERPVERAAAATLDDVDDEDDEEEDDGIQEALAGAKRERAAQVAVQPASKRGRNELQLDSEEEDE